MIEALLACALIATDGDSLRCGSERIRLVAASGPIDAPETQYRRGRWNDRAKAEQARQRLSQLATGGVLICSGRRDRYNRALCRVESEGIDAGDQLVHEGLAVLRPDWR